MHQLIPFVVVISAIEAELIVKVEVKPQKAHPMSVNTKHLATSEKILAGAVTMCRTTSA